MDHCPNKIKIPQKGPQINLRPWLLRTWKIWTQLQIPQKLYVCLQRASIWLRPFLPAEKGDSSRSLPPHHGRDPAAERNKGDSDPAKRPEWDFEQWWGWYHPRAWLLCKWDPHGVPAETDSWEVLVLWVDCGEVHTEELDSEYGWTWGVYWCEEGSVYSEEEAIGFYFKGKEVQGGKVCWATSRARCVSGGEKVKSDEQGGDG